LHSRKIALDKTEVLCLLICWNANGVTVQLFERRTLARAFRLPLWGQAADEVPPQWFIRRLQSGEFAINSLGGVTMANQWGHQQCAAGDFVLLTDEDAIQFATPEQFVAFEPVSADRLLHAA
jgi:hypothetical protein